MAPASSGRPTRSCSDDAVIGRTWRESRAVVLVGTVCTVAGGLLAAVSRPLDIGLGPWASAFLVLVGGMAPIGLMVGQSLLATAPVPARLRRGEITSWYAGVAATLVGSFVAGPAVTTLGAVLLAVALALFLAGTRSQGRERRFWRGIYRALVVVVLAGAPIGAVLAWVRHG